MVIEDSKQIILSRRKIGEKLISVENQEFQIKRESIDGTWRK